jgi:hypothetical protein
LLVVSSSSDRRSCLSLLRDESGETKLLGRSGGPYWLVLSVHVFSLSVHEFPDQYRARGYLLLARLAGKIYVWIEPPSAQEVFLDPLAAKVK